MAQGKQAFERKLQALQALRADGNQAAVRVQLAAALADRNNYFVARAAELAVSMGTSELCGDLVAAFERFLREPVKSDPHCLAKTAIARALRDLGQRDPEVFVRGIGYVQMEPAWGGPADTAAGLRGACALALANTNLGDLEILAHLTDALADPDTLVRLDAARAIESLNREEGALLLRLKLLTGDPEADVQGQCFSSYLTLAPRGAVSFISRFLRSPSEDVQLEAASALAQCRDPAAVEVLREFWREPRVSHDVRVALLMNLGASVLREAADMLVELVEHEAPDLAATAIAALATSRYRTEIREVLAAKVAARDSSYLHAEFERTFAQ